MGIMGEYVQELQAETGLKTFSGISCLMCNFLPEFLAIYMRVWRVELLASLSLESGVWSYGILKFAFYAL